MIVRRCAVEGCDKPHHARGYCDSHYRWSRDNGWAEADYPLPVYYAGKRYRPVSTAYDRSGDEGPPVRRACPLSEGQRSSDVPRGADRRSRLRATASAPEARRDDHRVQALVSEAVLQPGSGNRN